MQVDVLTPEAAGERDRAMQDSLWIGRKVCKIRRMHAENKEGGRISDC
jgi:hypothetical protein